MAGSAWKSVTWAARKFLCDGKYLARRPVRSFSAAASRRSVNTNGCGVDGMIWVPEEVFKVLLGIEPVLDVLKNHCEAGTFYSLVSYLLACFGCHDAPSG